MPIHLMIESSINPLLQLGPLDPIEGGEELHILPGLQASVDRQMLRDIPQLRAEFSLVLPEILPFKFHASEIRLHQIADHVHGGALSRTVGAKKAEHLPLLDLDVQVIHHNLIIIFLCKIFGLKNGFHICLLQYSCGAAFPSDNPIIGISSPVL